MFGSSSILSAARLWLRCTTLLALVLSSSSFLHAQDRLTVSSVSPDSGTTEGNTTVTLFGSGFQSDMQVWFGATQGEVVGVGENTMDVIVPAHVAGAVQLSVKTEEGGAAHSGYIFTFVAPRADDSSSSAGQP